MKSILVPTDFSNSAETAINFAVQSAKILPASVTLLHSFEINSSIYTDYMGVNKEFNASLLNESGNRLSEIKTEIEEKDKIVIKTILSTDSLQEAIKIALGQKKFEFIVMGTLGASGIQKKLWGSKTSETIGKSDIPVLAIPNDYQWKKPQKILFATNRFEKDRSILDFIFELAGLYMASVQVAVFTDEDDDKAGTFVENKRKISEYETFLKKSYNEDTLTSAHLYGEDFEETLHDFIKKNNIDLLVMVTYPHNFWNRILNPSKTKRMSYNTKIPLLAIPAVVAEKK